MDETRKEYQSMGPMGTQACRMSAKAVIEKKIIDLEREIAALQVLIDSIPWKILTAEDEERSWNYFVKNR
uniref:Uncharacterized protein n=1 Tax=viral metagenome TaxID=1070528 RepID=A0A6H1ZSF2_9ZZZZ